MNRNPSVEEVLQSIRTRIAEREAQGPRSTGVAQSKPQDPSGVAGGTQRPGGERLEIQTNDLTPLRSEIETALEGTRRIGQINPRNHGLHNDAIQLAKKVMRRSLTWYTRPLHYFQGGAVRALQRIESVLQSHEQSLQRLSREFGRQTGALNAELDEKVAGLRMSVTELTDRAAGYDLRLSQTDAKLDKVNATEIATLRFDLVRLHEELKDMQQQSRLRDRDLRRVAHEARSGASASAERKPTAMVSSMFPVEIKRESDFDYFAFEDLYRGSEVDIRCRQKAYVEYFRGRDNVLDVGCGRGEFLELLRDYGIDSKGVEAGTDQCLLCREKGLEVVQQDLFSYLEGIPDGSLGGLFSAQVIEHLSSGDQLRLVALAYQKTREGSPVIVETINAQCVWAMMRNFFLDPTHVRPMHPEALQFAMNSVGFKNVEIRFSTPMSEKWIPPLRLNGDLPDLTEFNRRIQDLNELVYGGQDYAAIGWRQ